MPAAGAAARALLLMPPIGLVMGRYRAVRCPHCTSDISADAAQTPAPAAS